MNLSGFFIDSIAVHDVPRRAAGDTADAIVYSEAPSELDDGLRNFFRERTIRSLAGHGYEVERDMTQASSVPDCIAGVLAEPDDLVSLSQDVAQHLWSSQTGVNPAGLLVVARGSIGGSSAVAILKLEREDAIRVHEVQLDGKRSFSVAHLRDLMLGKNTRLFKASLFTIVDEALDGLVSDDQRGYDPTSEVAQFFLSRFLGCRLKQASDVTTKAFFERTQEWINDAVEDDATKARYEVALLAAMNSPTKTIAIKNFADGNLDVPDRTPYRTFMQTHGVPSTVIEKDTQLVARRIALMTYATSEGIRVSGSPEKMDELVDVRPDGPDGPVIEIKDNLKDVRGGR